MNSINKIAKITLQKIFSQGLDEFEYYDEDNLKFVGTQDYSISFSSEEIDFDQVINYKDSRDSDYVPFADYYIWGIKLGLKKIESLASGKKILSERLVNEVRRGFIQDDGMERFIDFSHIIEINSLDEEIIVYRVTNDQWESLAKAKYEADSLDIPIIGYMRKIV